VPRPTVGPARGSVFDEKTCPDSPICPQVVIFGLGVTIRQSRMSLHRPELDLEPGKYTSPHMRYWWVLKLPSWALQNALNNSKNTPE